MTHSQVLCIIDTFKKISLGIRPCLLPTSYPDENFIDFHKAFDTVEHHFFYSVLDFGDFFINSIKGAVCEIVAKTGTAITFKLGCWNEHDFLMSSDISGKIYD